MEKLYFGETLDYYKQKGCSHTVSEIKHQPEMWKKTAAIMTSRKNEISDFMDKVTSIEGLRIITTGAGSSAFIGESLQLMLANEMGLRSENIHTTDIISCPDSVLYDVPTLLISYARSGESPESLAACKFAEKRIKDLYQIIIVCDKNSTLAKSGYGSDRKLVLDMPPETCDKGFAMTSSVSSMALATWCLFHYKEMETYANYVCILADSMEEEFDSIADMTKAVANVDYRRLIWLGTGALRGLAREACVKSMEVTDGYVHAGYDAPTGFRHGPKTVVNDETMTIHYLNNQEYSSQYDIDFINEMIAEKKGNKVVTVKPQHMKDAVKGEDYEVIYSIPTELPTNSEMGAYIKALVFSQMLSMFKSLDKGYQTDSPSVKGDVNRVVQGIVIHDL